MLLRCGHDLDDLGAILFHMYALCMVDVHIFIIRFSMVYFSLFKNHDASIVLLSSRYSMFVFGLRHLLLKYYLRSQHSSFDVSIVLDWY